MRTVLIILGALVVLFVLIVGGFVAWRLWATWSGAQESYAGLARRIEPIESRLAAGQDPEAADLERFARDRVTRRVLYDALSEHQKLHLFPAAFRTPEALAEADLVLWLAHPNELAAPPDEIELMATVPAPGAAADGSRYFVFRFRTRAPHWAADDGWMAGVAGPFGGDGRLEGSGAGTFSRFESFESRTPEEHVRVTYATNTNR